MTFRRFRPFAVLAAALAFAIAPLAAAVAAPAAAASVQAPAGPEHVVLSAPDGRAIDVSVWQAADERAVVVFSHGHGGRPEAYQRIIQTWVARGFTVVAPLHVDSLVHPDRAAFDGPAGFTARIVDLAVVRGYVRATHPGRPMVAAGHSYGSLMSLIEAGADTVAGPQGDPDIRAVVAFSSAGDLPGVVTPRTYAAYAIPTLMITGDADLVPGFVTDWRAHRSPFDRSLAGGKMLLVFAGADHSLVRNADADDFAVIARTTGDFIEAWALDDAAAKARLDAETAPDGLTIERR